MDLNGLLLEKHGMNNVVMVYPSISYKGGVERVMAEVLKFLVGHGVSVKVICAEIDPSLEPLCSEVLYEPCRGSSNPLKDIWLRVSWMLGATRLVKSLSNGAKVVSAPCALFSADIVMAGSCHLAAQVARLSQGSYKWLLNPKHWFYIFAEGSIFLRRKSTVLVPSKRTQAEIKRFYPFARNRTFVLPHGVDLKLFIPNPAVKLELVDRLKIARESTIFLTVTNEIKRKGCYQVLEALAMLRDAFPKMHYVVAGRDDPQGFKARVRSLGLDKMVTVLPGVHGDDLVRLYQGADLFLLPTEYESFGLVGIESLACSVPVLSTRVGGLEDYVADNEDGFFVERTGDSVREGLRKFMELNPEQHVLMRIKARQKAENYNWSGVLKPLLNLVGSAKA